MFNRNSARSYAGSSSTSSVSVNIEAADASDAARLLKEIQDKAHENIRRAMPLENNIMKCTLVEVMDIGGRGVMAVFELNGKRMTAKVVSDFRDEPEDLIRKVFEEMSRVIAAEVLAGAMNDLPRYGSIFR